MRKHAFPIAFALGALSVVWVAAAVASTHLLVLVMTAVIGAVYVYGAQELRHYRRATAQLSQALADVPADLQQLDDWLVNVPASLQNAVRQRIEGERSALPGPAFTPYLVGLLVMLGMLGTFLGLVVTFKGAVFALEASTDLQAVRAALAEPIKGLGLSFGTSIAGVAASALLGLMSAISRRERLEAAHALDGHIATHLRPFSAVHQRQETFRALQAQAAALPAVMERMEALMERLEARSRQLDAQMAQRQEAFHRDVTVAYSDLAHAVGVSLKDSLATGAKAAGETIEPVVSAAMARIVDESHRMQQQLGAAAQAQSEGLLARLSEQLARTQAEQAQAEQQRLQAWSESLQAMAAALQAQWQQAGEQAAAQQQAVLQAVEAASGQWVAQSREQSDRVLASVEQLMQTASALPESVAGVITQLREEMARVAERENLTLQERTVLLEQLGTLMQAIQQASGQSADLVSQVGASAVELGSLGEAFTQAVQLFQSSNEKLVDSLQRIDASLGRVTARSDEQLAYYVAQAREVIDLSIASQQGLVDSLRQLQASPARTGGKAAAAKKPGQPAETATDAAAPADADEPVILSREDNE